MKVSTIGEFGLIERLRRFLSKPDPRVIVGIGDDVAVLEGPGDMLLLATCDIQVEGVHFLRSLTSPYQLGRKALAINLSDVASMGGLPDFALISLSLPPDTDLEFIDELYRGLSEEAEEAGVKIVGGNIARLPERFAVDVFLIGRVERGLFLTRRGAKPGDVLMVTGTLGDSAAGLALLLKGIREERFASLYSAHLTPKARLKEGRTLALGRLASSAIDISDGLAKDVGHICDESGVGVAIRLADIPLSPELKEAASLLGVDPFRWALAGGEDYQLLFTVPPEKASQVRQALHPTPVSEIGLILAPQEGRYLLLPDGSKQPLEPEGWDHFASV
jgi:thiamine-monophosphate kinase